MNLAKLAIEKKAVSYFVTFLLIGYLGLWEETMITLAMVISSVFFCAIVGIPLGIMSGRSDRFELFLRPALDAIQTIGAFPTQVDHVDFLSADAHKWMLGPMAIGIVYVAEKHFDFLRPSLLGGMH